MTRKQNNREIDSAAADWVARADRGALSPEESRALEAWLEGDHRCLGAYSKALAVFHFTDRAKALGPNFDPAPFIKPRHGLNRRRVFWLGGAATAAAIAGITFAPGLDRVDGGYSTRRGEVRLIPLADGSAVTLNTASRVKVTFSAERREVLLLEGEALFDVAKDPGRPFIVKAGDTEVRAVGTSFAVRMLEGEPVEVLVQEGVVEMARLPALDVKPVRVGANMKAVAFSNSLTITMPATIRRDEVERQLAWREGDIAFEGVTLRQAIDEFARYSDIRITVDDPHVASQTITGLFSAHNPRGFAHAVASSLGLHVDEQGGEITLKP